MVHCISRLRELERGSDMNIEKYYRRAEEFIKEVGLELRKSEWPSRQELVESSVVVVLSVVALAVFIGVCDFALFNALKLLIGK